MKARVIIVAGYEVFIELAEMIKYSLETLNYEVDIVDDHRLDYKADYDIQFIIRAFRPFPAYLLKQQQPKSKLVLFQTEECWNDREKKWYRSDLITGVDRVLEMYDENVALPGASIVVYCPVGYSPVWEYDLPEVEEDIDVFFHGSMTDRRKQFCSMIESMGLKKTVFTNKVNYFGKERAEMIMRSKIVINIKANEMWSYGPLHCLPTQCQKKFMLAEKANGGYGPFKPGVHMAEYDGMADCKEKIRYWLEHEKERKEFAKNAYEDMVKTCDFTELFKSAMGNCTGGRPQFSNLRSLI
jgi:hypothetical protein